MSNGAAAGGAAAAAAAIAQAIKASGAIVRVAPEEFRRLADRAGDPLVVTAMGGFLGRKHQYLMGYKGLAFFASSPDPIQLPANVELVAANKIWIPG